MQFSIKLENNYKTFVEYLSVEHTNKYVNNENWEIVDNKITKEFSQIKTFEGKYICIFKKMKDSIIIDKVIFEYINERKIAFFQSDTNTFNFFLLLDKKMIDNLKTNNKMQAVKFRGKDIENIDIEHFLLEDDRVFALLGPGVGELFMNIDDAIALRRIEYNQDFIVLINKDD